MAQQRKIIGILQPVYLPWLGYFEQMACSDLFVFMDDVQYTRRDWRNRNRIKTASGSIWLTVPVRQHPRGTLIKDISINHEQGWARKHIRSIEVSYQRCPFFEPLFSELAQVLGRRQQRLLELDCDLIALLCRHLEIGTPTACSSAVPRAQSRIEGHDQDHPNAGKNRRIIEICRHFGATALYDGARAAAFVDSELFRRNGIEVVFQDYQHPTYPQAFGEFAPQQSVIDLIMNTGAEAATILRSSPLPAALHR